MCVHGACKSCCLLKKFSTFVVIICRSPVPKPFAGCRLAVSPGMGSIAEWTQPLSCGPLDGYVTRGPTEHLYFTFIVCGDDNKANAPGPGRAGSGDPRGEVLQGTLDALIDCARKGTLQGLVGGKRSKARGSGMHGNCTLVQGAMKIKFTCDYK